MLSRSTDPIIAVATAPGRGAVGIVRVSGRGLAPLVEALLKRTLRPREATYLPFPDIDGQPIDQGLALFFPAPHSFTGEDVLELQAHGGDIVLQLLVARCLEVAATRYESTGPPVLPHLRVAEPGEFSARAFHNGKLDLAQSEAVADLIDASTEASARSATRSLSGAFSRDIGQLREGLIRLRMLVEATLDFPEEDIDFLERDDAAGQLAALQDQLALVRGRARQGALLREGIRVVIAGQPNAGKSSLLNALAGAELAIVSPVAGTTRDVVSQSIQIEGVPLHVVDTAGLRQSTDEIERIGIERAWQQIRDADVVLHVHDLTLADNTEVRAATQVIRNELRAAGVSGLPVIDLWNKCDLGAARLQDGVDDGLRISARSGAGLQDLRQKLLTLAGWQPATEGIYLARARHLDALAQVDTHLCVATRLLSAPTPALDLLAEELRLTQSALNQITGEFVADDLLGEIFSRFCIGK